MEFEQNYGNSLFLMYVRMMTIRYAQCASKVINDTMIRDDIKEDQMLEENGESHKNNEKIA